MPLRPENRRIPSAPRRRGLLVLRKIVEARVVIALTLAGCVGAWGVHAHPISRDNVFLGLIGERTPGVLAALRRLFRDESFDILSTSDPQEAFEWIRTRHVGALLADDRMPGMSGTTLFHLAKAHSPSTARIMLTGHAGEKIILHAREQGLFQVFAKPWDDQELKRTIRERLRERELGGVSPAGPLSD